MSYIRVLNKRIPLDNSYENVITFKDLYSASGMKVQAHMTKDAYFKSFDSNFGNIEYYQKVNFRYGDSLKTSCKLTDVSISSNVLTGLNYAHVINNENPRYPSDLYYFITDILYLSGSVIQLELELDVFTTYFDYTGFKNDGVIFTKRCHCDRFNHINGIFGCDEALLPDIIDGAYSPSILKTHTALFTNYKYIVLYLSNNTPRVKYDGTNITRSLTEEGGYILNPSKQWEIYPRSTMVNGYPAPYIMAVIPINGAILSATGSGFKSILYGINETYPDIAVDDIETFYSLYTSNLVLAMQFTNFDFSSYLTLSTGRYLCDARVKTQGVDKFFNAPAVMITEISNKKQTSYNSNINLYKNVGLTTDFTKTHMQSLTKRELGLEPKLYTNPYTKYTYTSATDKEYNFEPMLITKYDDTLRIERIFTPNPTSNGEMTFITSEPYNHYESNYMGSSPVQNNELPTPQSNITTYLETIKNSYYTGLALGVANSMVGGISNIGSSLLADKINKYSIGVGAGSNILDYGGRLATLSSKFRDMESQPNKLGNTNFDIYSIVACTDTNKYLNTWTLIDEELKKVADFYYMNGYEVDMFRSCNMKSNYITCAKDSIVTRKLFDLVQLDENIVNQLYYDKNEETPLSQVVRDKFNSVFSQGVRLWFLTSTEQFRDFTLENKEVN